MAVEIGKLNVKISVNQAKSEGGEGSSTAPSEQDAGKRPNPEKLAQDVIEQVMKIMDDKNER